MSEDAVSVKKVFFDQLYALDEDESSEPRDARLVHSMNALAKPTNHIESSSLVPSPLSARKVARAVSNPLTTSVQPTLFPTKLQTRHTITGEKALDKLMVPTSSTVSGNAAARPTKSTPIQSTTTPKRLFEGLHFYFFPNNDIHPGRRFRINKAIQYGATWIKTWSDVATHVIVDRSMNHGQVLAYLKLDALPSHVVMVDEAYPADCISYRALVPPDQRQYRVKGQPEPTLVNETKSTSHHNSSRSDVSLQLKPPGKAFMTREAQTPSASTSSPVQAPLTLESNHPSSLPFLKDSSGRPPDPTESSELDLVIDEAKRLQYMPLDFDEDEKRHDSDGRSSSEAESEPPAKKAKRGGLDWQAKFQCMQKHTGKNEDGPNASTITLLQELADYYNDIKDQWRPIAYRKAIAQLRNHPAKVTTKEDALKIPYIGTRLAEKIEEIVYTNHLRRLENARSDPTDKIIQLFNKIYGVGFAQAMKFVDQGFKTLQDLRTKASLNENQKVGIEHYDDFDARIPRREVEQHAEIVKQATLSLDKAFEVYTMGSYRRGAETSGDIDIIFTHPTMDIAHIRGLILEQLVPHLFKQGFLKVTLAETARQNGTKWHGASCLPSSKIWRRIDFLLVPHEELGAALIYFTGNDIFNRSLRLLASRKGMRLNQRGLYKECLRGKGREKVTEGVLVEGQDEKKIFEALGVPWRPPEHRIC